MNTMVCKYCGKVICEDSVYCKYCGEVIDTSPKIAVRHNSLNNKTREELIRIILRKDKTERNQNKKIQELSQQDGYTYKYPRPSVTADCVVITREAEPKVLLIQRGFEPYKGCWAFPGGFMDMKETTEQCAIRELEEETGLKVNKVHQIGAYSKVDRDPRGRTITVAYLAIVDSTMEVVGQDDAAKAQWFPLSGLPQLAFDHAEIMEDAIRTYNEFAKWST